MLIHRININLYEDAFFVCLENGIGRILITWTKSITL